jgi:two-component system sensor histidine kinase CpxA
MRSIFAKILIWSLGTFALSLIAFWAISRAIDWLVPRDHDFFPRMISLIEDDVCRSYEEGGSAGLAAHLRRVDRYLSGEHILTDPKGRDLTTGTDRSDLLRRGQVFPEPPRVTEGRMVLVSLPRGGRYRFISVVMPPPHDHWMIWPYYGAVVLVIALMGAMLALYLAAPLRRLRRVVESFGSGDLGARVASTRRDEIGDLSRSFDEMAARIATLLEAERRLLMDVSHELRSPLARLGFAVELARTGTDREAALARVRKEAERMATLVSELLELTRVEGDPNAGNPEPVSLSDLLGDIIKDCDLEAEARGCQLILRADRTASVAGERELLRRAVENVVRNAIRHAPDGTSVDIGMELRGDVAAVSVRDYGPGVPADLVGKIFNPFFRAEDDRARASGGVGLGLAIARRAVDVHQGRITARNVSPGLLVTIELPHAWAVEKSS